MPVWWCFVCILCSVNVRYTLAVGIAIDDVVVAGAAVVAVDAIVVGVIGGAAVEIGTDSMPGLKCDANGLLAVLHFMS